MLRVTKIVKTNPLVFSFLLPIVTDGVFTLVGQNASYWHGYRNVNEGGPAYFLLAAHPLVYVAGGLLYLAFCSWLVYRLRHPLNILLAVALTIGHSWGSSTWLIMWLERAGFMATRLLILLQWTLLIGFFVLVAVCAGLSFAQYMRIYKERPTPYGHQQ
jgi:hypothetical protein